MDTVWNSVYRERAALTATFAAPARTTGMGHALANTVIDDHSRLIFLDHSLGGSPPLQGRRTHNR